MPDSCSGWGLQDAGDPVLDGLVMELAVSGDVTWLPGGGF